ncbi:hypothetical protein Bbelb_418140 [Branchiostoma belcheri]|nr:hypothetical protein Bbelb_418140 [Branchiostoma belcheri]
MSLEGAKFGGIRLGRRAASVLGGYGKPYLTMFLCVLRDLSVFLSNIPGGSVFLLFSRRICLCVFLRDLSPIYKTREHRTLTVNCFFFFFNSFKNGVYMLQCVKHTVSS